MRSDDQLFRAEYEIAPLNPHVEPKVHELHQALKGDHVLIADSKREGFYELVSGNGLVYPRVYAPKVYLVGYSQVPDWIEDDTPLKIERQSSIVSFDFAQFSSD